MVRVHIKEAVDVSAVRVLKNKDANSESRFLFSVTSHTTTLTPIVGRDDHKISCSTNEIRASDFKPIDLSSPASIYRLALSNAFDAGLFLVGSSMLLAQEISKILLTRFQFTETTLRGGTPITIVVQVDRTRDVTYKNPVIPSPTRREAFADEELEVVEEEVEEDEETEAELNSVSDDLDDDEFYGDNDEGNGYSEITGFDQAEGFLNEDRCSICLDGFLITSEVAKTRCGHVFHKDCLAEWLCKYATCPMCRATCIAIV